MPSVQDILEVRQRRLPRRPPEEGVIDTLFSFYSNPNPFRIPQATCKWRGSHRSQRMMTSLNIRSHRSSIVMICDDKRDDSIVFECKTRKGTPLSHFYILSLYSMRDLSFLVPDAKRLCLPIFLTENQNDNFYVLALNKYSLPSSHSQWLHACPSNTHI